MSVNKQPSLSNSKCSTACFRNPRADHTAKGGRLPQDLSSSQSAEDAAQSEDSPLHGYGLRAAQSNLPHAQSPLALRGTSVNPPRSPVRDAWNSSSARNSPATDSESAVGTGLSE